MKPKSLYLGTDPSRYPKEVVHFPLIGIKQRPLSDFIITEFSSFTHIVFTSPNAVRILTDHFSLQNKQLLAIGKGTEDILRQKNLVCIEVAHPETQEGMIQLIKKIDVMNSYFFYPRSSSARPLLSSFLKQSGSKHVILDLYDTFFLKPDFLPNLTEFDEIIFTSPTTVKAFLALYGAIPKGIKKTCIGPITEEALRKK